MFFKILFFLICFFVEGETHELTPSQFSIKDKILETLKVEIAQKISASDFNISLEGWADNINLLSQDNITFTIRELSINDNQRQYTALLNVNQNVRKVMGQIDWLIEIPVFKNPLKAGDIIKESDITWQKQNADKLSPTIITKKEQIIGKALKNITVKLGVPVRENDLEAPILVKKGNSIQVNYNSKAIHITTFGTAQSSGALNDVISFTILSDDGIRSSKTNLIKTARVVGPNQAEIITGSISHG